MTFLLLNLVKNSHLNLLSLTLKFVLFLIYIKKLLCPPIQQNSSWSQMIVSSLMSYGDIIDDFLLGVLSSLSQDTTLSVSLPSRSLHLFCYFFLICTLISTISSFLSNCVLNLFYFFTYNPILLMSIMYD